MGLAPLICFLPRWQEDSADTFGPRYKLLGCHQKAPPSKNGFLGTEDHWAGTQCHTKMDPRTLSITSFNQMFDQEWVMNHIEARQLDTVLHILQECLQTDVVGLPAKRKSKPWFDPECYTARNKVLQRLHTFKDLPNPETRRIYMQERSTYTKLLHRKRKEYAHRMEQQLIREAENKAYKILDLWRTTMVAHIPMETWEAHYCELLHRMRLTQHDSTRNHSETGTSPCITEAEVWSVAQRNKSLKAAGPDNIANELIKESLPYTASICTTKCTEFRTILNAWRRWMINMIYKGKGPQRSPDSYRGIALECAAFKMLSNVIRNRIFHRLMESIPMVQRGFILGRSTV